MGWMCVERTTATMGGMIEVIIAISAVQDRLRARPPSLAAAPQTVCSLLVAGLRQHRRGWAEGL